MFVTRPQFKESTMTAMAAHGGTYWRAVVADFPVLPWYLFLHEGQVLDAQVNQVMLVAWEEDLAEAVHATPGRFRRAVYRVDPASDGGLQFREVDALWEASEQGRSNGFMALLALKGSPQPVDAFLHPVPPEYVGELVYQAPNRAASK